MPVSIILQPLVCWPRPIDLKHLLQPHQDQTCHSSCYCIVAAVPRTEPVPPPVLWRSPACTARLTVAGFAQTADPALAVRPTVQAVAPWSMAVDKCLPPFDRLVGRPGPRSC